MNDKKIGVKALIDLAIEVALNAHQNQFRKGTDIPYITHPLAVGIILAKAGCSDDVIAGGILHDTVEDTAITLDYLQDTFGERVATIVKGASEPDKSLPWEKRKAHTIAFLKTATLEDRLVACADKLHNIRTIAAEVKQIGDNVWSRFKRGKKEQEWYYRGLVKSLREGDNGVDDSPLFQEFSAEVENLFS